MKWFYSYLVRLKCTVRVCRCDGWSVFRSEVYINLWDERAIFVFGKEVQKVQMNEEVDGDKYLAVMLS